MLTAVIEREGPVIRFNERFLDFLRPLGIVPRACNVGKAHEKGKVEKGAIHYIRNNFWPLRTFTDLSDLQAQATQWRDEVANTRIHATTGERPIERFRPDAHEALPDHLPDCRETVVAKVRWIFPSASTATPTASSLGDRQTGGRQADQETLTIYLKEKVIATHSALLGAKAENRTRRAERSARKHSHRHWLSQEVASFVSLGDDAKTYLERLAASNQPLQKV
jgi:hypothetical protein